MQQQVFIMISVVFILASSLVFASSYHNHRSYQNDPRSVKVYETFCRESSTDNKQNSYSRKGRTNNSPSSITAYESFIQDCDRTGNDARVVYPPSEPSPPSINQFRIIQIGDTGQSTQIVPTTGSPQTSTAQTLKPSTNLIDSALQIAKDFFNGLGLPVFSSQPNSPIAAPNTILPPKDLPARTTPPATLPPIFIPQMPSVIFPPSVSPPGTIVLPPGMIILPRFDDAPAQPQTPVVIPPAVSPPVLVPIAETQTPSIIFPPSVSPPIVIPTFTPPPPIETQTPIVIPPTTLPPILTPVTVKQEPSPTPAPPSTVFCPDCIIVDRKKRALRQNLSCPLRFSCVCPQNRVRAFVGGVCCCNV